MVKLWMRSSLHEPLACKLAQNITCHVANLAIANQASKQSITETHRPRTNSHKKLQNFPLPKHTLGFSHHNAWMPAFWPKVVVYREEVSMQRLQKARGAPAVLKSPSWAGRLGGKAKQRNAPYDSPFSTAVYIYNAA